MILWVGIPYWCPKVLNLNINCCNYLNIHLPNFVVFFEKPSLEEFPSLVFFFLPPLLYIGDGSDGPD